MKANTPLAALGLALGAFVLSAAAEEILPFPPKPAGPLEIVMRVNGEEVASGAVPVSAPLGFTANDCLDFGQDLGSPVALEYYDDAPFKFNGTIAGARVKYLGSAAEIKKEERQVEGPIPAAD